MERAQPAAKSFAIWTGLGEIYGRVSQKRRRELLAVLGLMLVGGIAELATIGSVVPFLALLSQDGDTPNFPRLLGVFEALGNSIGADRTIAAGIIFGGFAIFASLIRLQLAWLTQDFVYRLGHELAVDAQRRILSQPYSFHIEHNSSTLVSATDKVEILVFDVVLPLMQTVIASVIAVFLLAGLLYLDPLATLMATVAFVTVYLLVSMLTRNRLAANSRVIGTAYHERLKVEQESLGGIREVIIDNSQEMHLEIFGRINRRLALARATNNFMASAPRFIVEGLGMVIIAGIAALVSARQGGIGLALPFLGALALGAQRLLPLVQTIYTGWSIAAGYRSIIAQVVEFFRLPLPDHRDNAPPLPLRDRISIEHVSFSYPTRTGALEDVTIEIPCGSMVALIGETGSGKSTLADLLMGLLEPTSGQIRIDDVPLDRTTARRWQQNIAHVPQSIFLADASIGSNIALAFGGEALDLPRILRSAKAANLDHFVQALPQKYDTVVGERGIRLSGGQRQRLGVARAIYKQSPVLVLDEATSALDDATEAYVTDALEELRNQGRTVIVIAHRQSTIRHCNLIARLERGRVVEFREVSNPPLS